MKYTTNYSLKKPDLTDVVNIDDLNDNADIIDAQLNDRAQELDKKNISINLNSYDKGFKGLCVRTWESNSLYSKYFRDDLLNQAKTLKVDSIELIINTYQPTATDNNPATRQPINLQELEDYIKYLKSNDFKILFQHHVEIDESPYKWRAEINPSDANLWFINYTNLLLSYAQVCRKYNVEIFSIGSEYKTLTTKYHQNWLDLIDTIKDVYSGLLTYGANATSGNLDEVNTILFWDKLDYIGVDFYINPTTNTALLTNDIIKAFYFDKDKVNSVLAIDRIAKMYGKPVMFTEFGYGTTTDLTYQQNYLDAVLSLYGNKDYMKGLFLWVYDPVDGSTANYINNNVTSVVASHFRRLAKNTKKAIDLFSTQTNNSGSDKWVKIANISLLNQYTTASCIIRLDSLLPNTLNEAKAEIYFRVGSDTALNSYIECRLNSESTIPAQNIGYVKNENGVDLYVKLPNYQTFVYNIICNNGVELITLYDNPSFESQPVNLVTSSKIQLAKYPQLEGGCNIVTGTYTGSMNTGIIDTTITLPVSITTCYFVGVNLTDLYGGNAYDVNLTAKFMGNNTIRIYGKHLSIAGGYNYTLQWLVIGV